MNREQMIEKAAQVLWEAAWPNTSWDLATEDDRGPHLDDASDLVDAILPQVTTVAELEALSNYSFVVGEDGPYMVRHLGSTYLQQKFGEGWDCEPKDALAHGPLTVVWQPEVTA